MNPRAPVPHTSTKIINRLQRDIDCWSFKLRYRPRSIIASVLAARELCVESSRSGGRWL